MEEDSKGAVDYKTLFLGAVSCVVLLAGALWAVWNTRYDQERTVSQRVHDQQAEEIHTIEKTLAERQWFIKSHDSRLDSLEQNYNRLYERVLQLERTGTLRTR